MATNSDFTSTAPLPQNAEFVRKGQTGLELVEEVLGMVLLIPVKPKVTRIETGILVGHELDTSRSVLINLPNGQTQIMQVAQ